MKNIKLKIKGYGALKPTVKVDGKQMKFKKNEFGSFESQVQTDKDKVQIEIYRYLEINSRLWWLTQIFFFIISIFGILDPLKEKNCVVIDYKSELDLTNVESASVDLAINTAKNDGKAIELKSEAPCVEQTNEFYVDNKAKKRVKIMKFVKLFVFLACVAIVITALVLTFTK